MNLIAINVLLAILPTILIVFYFFKKDNQKPEPGEKIVKIFLIGFLSVIPAIVIELIFENATDTIAAEHNVILGAFIKGFIVAALVEESIKFFVVKKFAYPMKEFDEITDGIVYTITASLGFACFENLFYSVSASATSTLLLRGFTAVPLHAIASGIMGYYIGKSKFGEKTYFFKGLFYAILIHGFYDFLIFTETVYAFLIIPLLIISGIVLFRLLSKSKKADRKKGLS